MTDRTKSREMVRDLKRVGSHHLGNAISLLRNQKPSVERDAAIAEIKLFQREGLLPKNKVKRRLKQAKRNPRRRNAKDESFISERAALTILMTHGDYAESQARTILTHSRKVSYDGGNYYPMSYIYARTNEAKRNPRRSESFNRIIKDLLQPFVVQERMDVDDKWSDMASFSTEYEANRCLDIHKRKHGSGLFRLKPAKKNPRRRLRKLTTARKRVVRKPPRKTVKARKAAKDVWVICAHVNGTAKRYYWTGSGYDSTRVKAKRFPQLYAASVIAKQQLKKLPKRGSVRALEVIRLKDAH